MTPDQVVVVAALIGALVGSLASFAAQAVLDRSRERARAREAAAMLRSELVRGLTAVATLLGSSTEKLAPGRIEGFEYFMPLGTYFDTFGQALAGQMPRAWFTHVMTTCAEWAAAKRVGLELSKKGKLHERDRGFLDRWAKDADVSQELLLLTSLRWWTRRVHYRASDREVTGRLSSGDDEATREFGESPAASYFTFMNKNPRR